MPGQLQGKVAVITGAASGIGLATVELFAQEGASIVAADIQDEKGNLLARRFEGQVRYVHCDVLEEAEIAKAMAVAQSEWGGLDILFNNAGVSDVMFSIADIEPERWSWIFDLLVRAPVLGIKHATPLLIARGGGSIINTASIAGLQAGWGTIAYSSAKAAVMQMSQVAAAALSPDGIRINALCPGMIATSIFGSSFGASAEVAEEMAGHIASRAADLQPIARAGMPMDVARAALFLASEASAFITGTHLIVDGGITVGSRHSWDRQDQSPFSQLGRGLMPAGSDSPAGANEP